MLETRYGATKMKNAFDRLLSRLDTAEISLEVFPEEVSRWRH